MSLDEYMRSTGTTLSKMAEILEKPVTTVHGWKSGRRSPSPTDCVRIERATGGQVTVHDFANSAEAA